jgi:segregation and condensation protein B
VSVSSAGGSDGGVDQAADRGRPERDEHLLSGGGEPEQSAEDPTQADALADQAARAGGTPEPDDRAAAGGSPAGEQWDPTGLAGHAPTAGPDDDGLDDGGLDDGGLGPDVDEPLAGDDVAARAAEEGTPDAEPTRVAQPPDEADAADAATGAGGANAADGEHGATGIDGTNAVNGASGADGVDAADGATGVDGADTAGRHPGPEESGDPADGDGADGDGADGDGAGEDAGSDLPDVADDTALDAALEALLLVVDAPAAEDALAGTLGQPVARVAEALRRLSAAYTEAGRGIDLRRFGDGWRFYTRDTYAPYVEKFLLDGQRAKLTRAALETLAVIAYRQPVTRARVAAVRGVNVDGVIRTLLARGLVEETGADPDTGGILYRTTELFLERLGLSSLEQLPPLAPLLPEVDAIDDV